MESFRKPAPRMIVETEVEFASEQSPHLVVGECQNLSETGMLLLTDDPRPPGTRIHFRTERFQGHGLVVWRLEVREGTLLGIEFTELSSADREAVRRVLRSSVPWR
jgi:hypothetical protein